MEVETFPSSPYPTSPGMRGTANFAAVYSVPFPYSVSLSGQQLLTAVSGRFFRRTPTLFQQGLMPWARAAFTDPGVARRPSAYGRSQGPGRNGHSVARIFGSGDPRQLVGRSFASSAFED